VPEYADLAEETRLVGALGKPADNNPGVTAELALVHLAGASLSEEAAQLEVLKLDCARLRYPLAEG